MIPIYINPYPDELFYSWVLRLSKANALSRVNFYKGFVYGKDKRINRLPFDIRFDFAAFCGNLYKNLTIRDLYLSLTTYQFEALFMTQGQQARYINNVFRGNDKINTPVNYFFKTIKMCKKCMTEDVDKYGETYIHRSHQLKRVCVCYKHGTKLLKFAGKGEGNFNYITDNYAEIKSKLPNKSLQAYTAYVQKLFEAKIYSDIKTIKTIFFNRIKYLGYSAKDNYVSLTDSINKWEHKSLIKSKLSDYLKINLIQAENISANDFIPLLMFAFPNADMLIAELKNDTNIIELHKCEVCKKEYCSTQYADKLGFKCPYCEGKESVQDRYIRLIESIDGYKPISAFESMDKSVLIHHNMCNSDFETIPRAFLYDGVRCVCEFIVTEENANMNLNVSIINF